VVPESDDDEHDSDKEHDKPEDDHAEDEQKDDHDEDEQKDGHDEGEEMKPFIIKVSQHKTLLKILTSARITIISVKKYIERACREKESKFKGNVTVDRINLFDKSDDRLAEDDDIIEKETHYEMRLGTTGVKRARKRSVTAATEDDTEAPPPEPEPEPVFKKSSFLVRLEKGAELLNLEELKSARELRQSLQQRKAHTKNPTLLNAYNDSIKVVGDSISKFTGKNNKTMLKVNMKHAVKAREMYEQAVQQADAAFVTVLTLHEEAVGDAYGLDP